MGCDRIVFFDYNRINMGLGNEAVKEHMDALAPLLILEQGARRVPETASKGCRSPDRG